MMSKKQIDLSIKLAFAKAVAIGCTIGSILMLLLTIWLSQTLFVKNDGYSDDYIKYLESKGYYDDTYYDNR
jgi:hypothetical protein